MKKIIKCKYCDKILKKDWIALNKKLIDRNIKKFMCLECMADEFDCEVEDLISKIEEFKNEGCELFT